MKDYLVRRWRHVQEAAEAGMTTAEYAVGTIAAAAFGAVLWPASLENKPRRMPWANATPSPAPAPRP